MAEETTLNARIEELEAQVAKKDDLIGLLKKKNKEKLIEVCREILLPVPFPTVIIETGGKRGVYKGPRDSKDLVETVMGL